MHFNILGFILLIGFLAGCTPQSQTPPNTNILILLADDLGYADLHCYGGRAHTPNLDQLAQEGLRFTDFYAAAPNCSPSRAGLLTGKSPAMLGMYNYRPPQHPMHLRDSEITLAELLQAQGYQTAHIGKWHLGCLPQDTAFNHPQPHEQGFDYSLGTENNAQPSHLNPVNFVRNGQPLGEQQGYSCQLLADEALDWFAQKHDPKKPFFLYLPFHEPHKKVASPPELVAKYPGLDPKHAEYLANVENLDLAVGRILDYLKQQKLLDNTLILFTSDNGSYRQGSNDPLRAGKSYVYEGGIRVPGILYWSALGAMGREIQEAVSAVDVLPTVCDILGITPKNQEELAGTSILPLLKGEPFEREKPLYWFFYRTWPEIAVRVGDHVVLGKDRDTIPRPHQFSQMDMDYIKRMELSEFELYDLRADRGQYQDLMGNSQDSARYQRMVREQLRAIQEQGFYWDNMPEAQAYRRLKRNWVRVDR